MDRCYCPAPCRSRQMLEKNVLSWALARTSSVLFIHQGAVQPACRCTAHARACTLPLFVAYLNRSPIFFFSPCPLGKVLTYKNLILLNFPFYCVNTSYLVDRCRMTTHWMEGKPHKKGKFLRTLDTQRVNPLKAKLAKG